MEGEYPTFILPSTYYVNYDAMLLYTFVYSWIKLTPGKFRKKVLINNDQVKAPHFKPM